MRERIIHEADIVATFIGTVNFTSVSISTRTSEDAVMHVSYSWSSPDLEQTFIRGERLYSESLRQNDDPLLLKWGDSRAYLFNDQDLKLLNCDHSLTTADIVQRQLYAKEESFSVHELMLSAFVILARQGKATRQ